VYPLICCDAASVIGRDGVVMSGRRIIRIYFLYALWIIGATNHYQRNVRAGKLLGMENYCSIF
jgi:hypothetical protein